MGVMKRDVNLGLLLLIIVSIVLFAGFSVYYHSSFKDVSLEYQTKLEELEKVTGELGVKRQELNETYSLRLKAEQDRSALDQSYKEVSDERNQLESDKNNLQSELSSTKNELGEKSAQLQATQNLLASTQSELGSGKADRDKYRGRWNDVCDDYTTLNGGTEHGDC